jgi:hypothetical protein
MIIKFAIKIIHPCVHRHEFDQKAASAAIINWYCFCKLMLNMKNSSTPHPAIINFRATSFQALCLSLQRWRLVITTSICNYLCQLLTLRILLMLFVNSVMYEFCCFAGENYCLFAVNESTFVPHWYMLKTESDRDKKNQIYCTLPEFCTDCDFTFVNVLLSLKFECASPSKLIWTELSVDDENRRLA